MIRVSWICSIYEPMAMLDYTLRSSLVGHLFALVARCRTLPVIDACPCWVGDLMESGRTLALPLPGGHTLWPEP